MPGPQIESLLAELAAELGAPLGPGGLVGLYAAGSLAGGDYVPGISDLDLVALVATPLTHHQQSTLRRMHRRLIDTRPDARKLHCLYVPAAAVADLTAPHPMWDGARFTPRVFGAIARVELLRGGLVVSGPAPEVVLPPVAGDQLRQAARTELSGYWTRALRWRSVWWRDLYVDLGLLTLARASVTVRTGRLISKPDALELLGGFGVPPGLVAEIARRRRGEPTPLSPWRRARRARLVRRLLADGIPSVLAES